MNRIYPQVWLSLPKEIRLHLVFVFKLERTGVTEVRDQEVISDGYTVEDLGNITLEKMCEYIGSQETFARAWELTLSKVHAELNPPVGVIGGEKMPEPIIDDSDKEVPEEEIVTPPSEDMIDDSAHDIAIPFCDICDSKGVRHLKTCPKYVPIEAHSTKANPYAKL